MQVTTEIPENYLSYSRFELFLQCQAKFYHRYVDKSEGKQDPESPAILGSLGHKVLENSYQELLDEGYSGPLKQKNDVIQKHLKLCLSGSEFPANLFQPAQEVLKQYVENEYLKAENIISLEQQFVFELGTLGEIPILGYIDRIDLPDSDTVKIVDYKSNRMLYTAEELKQNLQASIYILAAHEMFPDAANIEMQFHMLRHGIIQRTSRTDEELEEARDFMLVLAQKIRSIDPDICPPESLNSYCPWCEYRHLCEAYREACEDEYSAISVDPNNVEAIAEQYENTSARAKILYARKEELADILKMQLINRDKLQTDAHVYRLGKTTTTGFTDVSEMIRLLSQTSGIGSEQIINSITTIGKGKFDEVLKDLKRELPEEEFMRFEAQLEELSFCSYQPRLQSTVIRKSKTS